jgi:hypothetical protein
MSESIERLREACLLASTHAIRAALDEVGNVPPTLREAAIDRIIANGRPDLLTKSEKANAIERRKKWINPQNRGGHISYSEQAWVDQVRQELVQLGAYPMKSAATAGRIGLSTEEK